MAVKIYTSRYSNKALSDSEVYAVGISLGRPRFPIDYRIREQKYMLAPERSMWGKTHEEFTKLYTEKLDKLGVEKVKSIIEEMILRANGKKLVLLCFEDIRIEGEFCHRTTLGEWLEGNVGYEVEELDDPTPPKMKKKKTENRAAEKAEEKPQPEYEQLSLFSFL